MGVSPEDGSAVEVGEEVQFQAMVLDPNVSSDQLWWNGPVIKMVYLVQQLPERMVYLICCMMGCLSTRT